MKERWLWPIGRFWTFTPLGWLLAVIWNICELLHLKMPYAPAAFGLIIGCRGKKVKDGMK
ncbi:TPA: hypothetical protein U5D73_000737 [Yersinia enterocolitica]|nr:hypothetical protein [Yersinia enterocolitica]HEN3351659.1 hypothetical protein [Yersinia enterocolitica]HEN3379989.1 hypothetical protein [Yersinia enterocolitica]HEN3448339.1 hypothetical protein [Yersinia enterocolitica]HEN3528518.1 hypothetical protein [Yersinia enterocolitica]